MQDSGRRVFDIQKTKNVKAVRLKCEGVKPGARENIVVEKVDYDR